MYNSVFNEYYRDQDLVTERSLTDVSLARIAWEKDYLSSARPWAQKGADVVLRLGLVLLLRVLVLTTIRCFRVVTSLYMRRMVQVL